MERFDDNDEFDKNEKEEIYSKAVRAGKRTYFFDVKATRKREFFLTITESKRRFDSAGNIQFEKHKIFLYKEDFEKFMKGMEEVLEYINLNQTELTDTESFASQQELSRYTNVDFESIR